jgi:Protein of unknown function (DUF3575)
MKKLLMLCSFTLVCCSAMLAQEKTDGAYHRSFTAKFVPGGLAVGKITFGGEFNFKRKNSLTFLVGLPFDKTRSIDYDNKTSDITSSARSAMLGYRYYLGKKARAGFYLEPYAKYVKLTAGGLLDGDINGRTARFDSRFNYEGIGAGLQLGFQFYIAKTVAFDFFLLGPEANHATFGTSSTDVYNNVPWSLADGQQAEQDIRDNLKDIPYIGKKIDVTVNTSTKTVLTSYKGFTPGLRAGLSVGIKF